MHTLGCLLDAIIFLRNLFGVQNISDQNLKSSVVWWEENRYIVEIIPPSVKEKLWDHPGCCKSSANYNEGLAMNAKKKGSKFCQEYKREGLDYFTHKETPQVKSIQSLGNGMVIHLRNWCANMAREWFVFVAAREICWCPMLKEIFGNFLWGNCFWALKRDGVAWEPSLQRRSYMEV